MIGDLEENSGFEV